MRNYMLNQDQITHLSLVMLNRQKRLNVTKVLETIHQHAVINFCFCRSFFMCRDTKALPTCLHSICTTYWHGTIITVLFNSLLLMCWNYLYALRYWWWISIISMQRQMVNQIVDSMNQIVFRCFSIHCSPLKACHNCNFFGAIGLGCRMSNVILILDRYHHVQTLFLPFWAESEYSWICGNIL